jgi:hypothetical protein
VGGWLAARSSIGAIQAYAEPSDEHEDWSNRLGRLPRHFWPLGCKPGSRYAIDILAPFTTDQSKTALSSAQSDRLRCRA